MLWVDYRAKLGIGVDDKQKFYMCMNRIRNEFLNLENYYYEDDLFRYLNMVGESIEDYYISGGKELNCALESVCRTKTLREFISKYVALINSVEDDNRLVYNKNGNRLLTEHFENVIINTLNTYRIPYEIWRDEDGLFIFPRGVQEFDNELITENLLWLAKYPETEKAWIKAIRDYSSGEEPSEVADNFRKALERFFQNFFDTDKTLENLKAEYGKYLKEHNVPAEIAGNLETLLQQYNNYMNKYAKHHDRTGQQVLEYIMYQTGNIMRLLIKLNDNNE